MALENGPPESNMKMKFFDVDINTGYKYEKNENLLSGLDRLNHNQVHPTSSLDNAGGIYLGGDTVESSVAFSEHRPPNYSYEKSFEDFAPYLSGKNRDLSDTYPPPYEDAAKKTSIKTKAIFDEAGIYLGMVFVYSWCPFVTS